MATPAAGEEDVRARLRGLEATVDAITDYAILKVDASGRVVAASLGVERVTGYSPSELIGRPVSAFHTAEDRDAGLMERELEAARQGDRIEIEGWRLRKGGQRFWVSGIIAQLPAGSGGAAGFVKVMRDTTERMRASAVFRELLESAPDATVIVGQDGRITLVNRQTEELFGYRREELIGQKVEILVPDRFRHHHPAHRDAFFAAPRVRPMGAGLDLYAVRRDGTEFPAEISLSPIRTDDGVLVSATVRDVTERREQLITLRRQRDEILELSTPVIQVWDKVLALPIIGTLDSVRAARLTEGLLFQIGQHQAEVVILDVSGVPTVDTLVAQHVLMTVQAATLMGAVSILSGLRPETAQAIVHLGIDLGRLRSRSTLRDALQLALRILRERAEAGESAEGLVTGNGRQ